MSLSTASGVDIGLELGERRGSDNIGVDEGGRGDEGERHLHWFKASKCNIGRNGAWTIAQLVAAHAAKQRPSPVRRQLALAERRIGEKVLTCSQ